MECGVAAISSTLTGQIANSMEKMNSQLIDMACSLGHRRNMTSTNPPLPYVLDTFPDDVELHSVAAQIAKVDGRDALRVELKPEVAGGVFGVDYADQPTFVIFPETFRNGRICVQIRSRLGDGAPDYARAFAGIAYRISEDAQGFEAVYVRPTNGRKVKPPVPRDSRAVQYFSYPEWSFERLRNEFPGGGYEAGADIAPDEWMTLSIEFVENRVAASINGEEVIVIEDTLTVPSSGRAGLWVDIGTEAYFSNLLITPAE
jgi:hypothetical protein